MNEKEYKLLKKKLQDFQPRCYDLNCNNKTKNNQTHCGYHIRLFNPPKKKKFNLNYKKTKNRIKENERWFYEIYNTFHHPDDLINFTLKGKEYSIINFKHKYIINFTAENIQLKQYKVINVIPNNLESVKEALNIILHRRKSKPIKVSLLNNTFNFEYIPTTKTRSKPVKQQEIKPIKTILRKAVNN